MHVVDLSGVGWVRGAEADLEAIFGSLFWLLE